MTTYNTGNAVGSSDPRDLYDNAQNLDSAINGQAATWTDRRGISRPSWAGMITYQDLGAYAGGIVFSGYNQIVLRSGEYYKVKASVSLPFTTTGTWGTDSSSLVSVGDAALRAQLANSASTDGAKLVYGAARVNNADQHGAAEDGTTDDTAGIASAITAAGNKDSVAVRGSALVASLSNDYGIEFTGPGEIIKAVTGGYQRLDTYADKHKYAVGKEYLYRLYARLAYGQSASLGTVKAFIYGDSTVAGGNGETADFATSTIISRLLKERGLGNINLTNRGVGGTKIGDMSALSDLSTTTDLYIIKYGINDGGNPIGTRLATFKTDLRSKLAAIRAATNGALANLSIVLVGPNSTSDSPNNRDERWYEQLRGIYIAAARDYQCAYFDTYAYLKDSRSAAGLWMDNPYADGRAIHPLDAMQAWIWGGVVDFMVGVSESRMYAGNLVTNQGAVSDTWLNATAPGSYRNGIHVQRATVANGSPFEGAVITTKSVDGPVRQQLFGFAATKTVSITRTADTTGNTWNRWTGVAEAIVLQNSWVSYGAPWQDPYAILGEAGIVTLSGLIKSGTTTAGTVLGTLPAGLRPSADLIFRVSTSAGDSSISIHSNGDIKAYTAADGTFTSLSGISFMAA